MLLLSNTLGAIASILNMLLNLYFWIVVAAALITWVSPSPANPIVRTLRMLTEPVFNKVRRWMPFTYTYGLDFSPVVVLIAIELVNRIVVRTMAEYARMM